MDDVIRVTGLTPEVAPEQAPAAPSEAPAEEEAKPVEEPAATEESEVEDATPQAAAAPSEEADPEKAEPEPPKKPARGVQKALDRLTAEREEARRQAAESQAALSKLINSLQAQKQPEAVKPPSNDAPKRESYPDWEQYNAAVARYEARQELRSALTLLNQQAETQKRQQAVQAQTKVITEKLTKAVAKGPERFKDWDDTVAASEAPITPSLATAISMSDDPALVMHHLGSHPDVHERFLQMSPEQQFYEIGKLSVVSAPKAVPSKAPAPAKPIGGARAGVGSLEYNDNFTPQQHKAWLARQ